MKLFVLCLAAVVLGTSGVIWFLASTPSQSNARPDSGAIRSSSAQIGDQKANGGKPDQNPATSIAPAANASTTATTSISQPAEAPNLSLIADRETAKEQLRLWTANTSPEDPAKVLAYLDHTDPEVRMAAAASLVLMGDASAAPRLLVAAEKASAGNSEVEAATLREAAELVSRPNTTPTISIPASNRKLEHKVWSPHDATPTTSTGATSDAATR